MDAAHEEPKRAIRSRRWGVLLLSVVVFLVLFVILEHFSAPSRDDRVVQLELNHANAEIYVGNTRAGAGDVQVRVTGDESFCLPLEDFTPAAFEKIVEARLGGELILNEGGAGFTQGEGEFFLEGRVRRAVLRKADGTLDSLILLGVYLRERDLRFLIPIRARSRSSHLLTTAGAGITGKIESPWNILVLRKRNFVSRIMIDLDFLDEKVAFSQPKWWIDRFPWGAPTLSED
jgi:hypothetical protein